MVSKQTSGEILWMKNIFFTLLVWKQRGGETLQTMGIFFKLKLHAIQINKWQNFKEKGYLFYSNGLLINRWQCFRDEGHLFYIQRQISR